LEFDRKAVAMTTKSDTIAAIMRLNPSVGAAFLSEFSKDDLALYLRRLSELCDSRPRAKVPPLAVRPRTLPEALQPA